MLLLYVAAGGAFGSLCRYVLSGWITTLLGKEFPYATLAVNVLGSLILGVLIAVVAGMLPRGRELHALIVVGALGGFTTFSAFAMDSYLLLERGQFFSAALYIILSVSVSVMAFLLGMWLFKAFAW